MSIQYDAGPTTVSLSLAAAASGGIVDGVPTAGSEYTAADHATVCRRLGVAESMGRASGVPDDAVAKAFNSTIKVRYIQRRRFRSCAEARTKIASWIVGFYNALGHHSARNGMSPVDHQCFMAEGLEG